MRKIRLLGFTAVVVFIAISVAGFFAYRASQQVPEFYLQALEMKPQQQEQAGDQLEKSVLDLHNDVRREGQWQATFTDEQINGWLAFDMPTKFNRMLPNGISDPRVAIETEQARIACRFENTKVNTIVSLGVQVELTEEPNVVAVRVCKARAGVLPIPLKRFLERITAAAQRADLDIRWAQEDGDPVALVRIPEVYEGYQQRLLKMETIELRDGAIYLAGRTERQPIAPNGHPRTASYQLRNVTLQH